MRSSESGSVHAGAIVGDPGSADGAPRLLWASPSPIRFGVIAAIWLLTLALDVATPLGIAAGIGHTVATIASANLRSDRETWIAAAVGMALTWVGLWLSPASIAPMEAVLANRVLSCLAIAATASAVVFHRRIQIETLGRLESLARISGGVAHDYNNLLTAIVGEIDFILERGEHLGEEDRQSIQTIEVLCDEARRLATMLYEFRRDQVDARESIELAAFLEHSHRLLSALTGPRVRVDLKLDVEAVEIRSDPTWIRQILVNLVSNASQAIGQRSGNISIRLDRVIADRTLLEAGRLDGDLPTGTACARIEVTDDGPGIQQDVVDRILESFFTTRSAGKGLGLASVASLVDRLGGEVLIRSSPGEGASFTLLIPTIEPGRSGGDEPTP